MPREDLTTDLLGDALLVAALRELKEAGGDKRFIHCSFPYETAHRLEQAGLIAISSGPTRTAMVCLTIKGRIALAHITWP